MPKKDCPIEYAAIRDQAGPDRRYCGVIAHALVCGLSFRQAAADLLKQGRAFGRGVRVYQLLRALKARGFTCRELPRLAERYRTVRSLEKGSHGKRTLVVFTCNHVLVLKDGKVLDWTKNRLNRIQSIYLVEK